MVCSARRNNAKGLTLAEAMIATVILSIAAAGVLAPFVAGASVRAEGQRMTLAAKLAADLTEQIVNTDFDSVVSTWDGFAESQGQVKDITGAVFKDDLLLDGADDGAVHPGRIHLRQQVLG